MKLYLFNYGNAYTAEVYAVAKTLSEAVKLYEDSDITQPILKVKPLGNRVLGCDETAQP